MALARSCTGAVRLWGAKGEHAQKNEYRFSAHGPKYPHSSTWKGWGVCAWIRLWSGMVKDIGWSGDSGVVR
eukprot:3619216-Amphidinium_carterae.1